MSDFEAIETREQFEEAVKDRLEQERETVRREFSGCLSPEAVEEKYKEYLSPKEAEEKYKGYLSPEDAANKDATIAKYEKESKRVKVAMENGIPYELAGKLSGGTEDEMKKDAEAFSKFLKNILVFMNAHPAGHRLLQKKPPLQHSATTATIRLYLPDGSRAIISRHMCCHSLCSEMPQKKNFGHGAGNAGFCRPISAPNSSWKK